MESSHSSEGERTHLQWRGRRGRFACRTAERTREIERGRKEREEEEKEEEVEEEEERAARRRRVKEELSRMLGSHGNSTGMPSSAKSPLAKNIRKRRQWRVGRREREGLVQSLGFARIGHSDYCHGNDTGNAHRRECMEKDREEEGEQEEEEGEGEREKVEGEFRPLLLFIPLRLGQEKFNMEYKEAIKVNYFGNLWF